MIHYEADRRKWTFNKIPTIGNVCSLDLNWVTGHSQNLMKNIHMVVILQATFLKGSPLRICVPLISYDPSKSLLDTHYVLKSVDYDFLEKDTIVKTEQLITINWQDYLADQNYLGSINKTDLMEIVKCAANALGIKEILISRR